MEKHITIRGISDHEAKHSNSIRNYINEHFSKIEKLLSHVGEPVNIDIVIDIIKPHPDHHVSMHIRAPHFSVIVKKDGPEIYKVIDEVLDVTVGDLIKHKEKEIGKKHSGDSIRT